MRRLPSYLSLWVCAASLPALAQEDLQEEAAPASEAPAPEREPAVEEIVVTGYSTVAKKDLTGAVSAVDMEEVTDLPAGNIAQNLQGRVPGVQITTSGNPDSKATVRIRGQGLGRLGFNDPLYVIDGVPTIVGLEQINPNDIESIQVLKDAASASIYGARAANGVVVVTTKKGAQGMNLSLRATRTTERFSYNLHPLSTEQRAQAVWQAAVNDRSNPNNASALYIYDWNNDYDNPVLNGVTYGRFTDDEGVRYIDGGLTMRPADTNWFGAVTRDSTIDDLNASLSTANEQSRFFGSLGYYNAEGVVDGSAFKRVSLRLNSDHLMNDGRVTVGQNFLITDQKENLINQLAGQILTLGIEQQSIVPIHTVDGVGWGGPTGGVTDRDNPVRIIDQNRDNVSTLNKVLGNVYVEYRPIDGLLLRSNLGIDYYRYYFRNYQREVQAGNLSFPDNLTTQESWQYGLVFSNTAEYKWAPNDLHSFTFLLGTETIDFRTERFFGSASGFASDSRGFAYLDQGTSGFSTGGGGDAWGLESYFTKVDYDYADRYLASVIVRRDGSSRFGDNNQWGNFPSVSAAWRLSEESFFEVEFVDDLKLRASWGQNGNQEISTTAASTVFVPRYSTTSLFTNDQDEGTAYDLNGANTGTLPSGFARVQTGNPDLKWETSTQTDIGLDFTMFDAQFYGSIDWFQKRTEDILTVTEPLAVEGEGAAMVVNGGTIDNKGVEILLGYDTELTFERIGTFQIGISANYATAENEVVDLPDDVVNSFGGNGQDKTILGHSVNSVYGYVADGLFQSQAEVDAHAAQPGAEPGRIRYRDLNNDGVIDEDDQDFFTSTDPDFLYGFNLDVRFRNWDFNMFWQGVHGGQIRNSWRYFTDFTSLNAGSNYGARTLDAWTPENADASVPALTLVDNNNEGRESSFYWEDASYLKLRNLSIGYSAPDWVLARCRLQHARIYLQAQNLLTIKPGGTLSQDPEAPGSSFPVPKRYTIGFEATF